MDVFDEELISFWKALNHFQVRFIMVGGVATNLHGYNRGTDDVDAWIKDTTEIEYFLEKLYNAIPQLITS